MDIAKELRMNSSKEYSVNIENVSICVLTDYANDYELPFKYKRGFAYPYYKVVAVSKGTVNIYMDYTFFTLKENDVAIIAPGNRYSIYPDDGSNYYCIGLEFTNNFLRGVIDYYYSLSKLIEEEYRMFENRREVSESIKKCFEAVTTDDIESIGVNVHFMINELMKLTGDKLRANYKESKSDMSRVHKINMLIHSFYDENISIEDVAKVLYLSQSQTIRLIRRYFGMTWKELIIKKRMEVALWSIANDSMPISEIASLAGYGSERGFYIAFKKYFGKSPSFYRGKHDLAESILVAQKTNINKSTNVTQDERE